MIELDLDDHYKLGGSVALVGLAVAAGYWWNKSSSSSLRPPGPKPSPIIKNLFDFPSKRVYEGINALRGQYGDAVYLELPGLSILTLSKLEEIEELLVKRDNVFSGRPAHIMVNELMGFQWSVLSTPPGLVHNELRKIFRKVIGAESVKQYDYLIEQEAAAYIQRISGFSGDPMEVTQDCMGAIIVKVAYGENIHREHGPKLIDLNTKSVDIVTWAFSQPWLPNLFPITKYLPSWFPGISFPMYARQGQELLIKLRYWAYGLVLQAEEEGKADPSVITRYLHDPEVNKEYLRDATALMYMGGVDTTSSAVLNFLLFMIMNPDVQRKLQEELDTHIGRSKTPNMNEVLSLPYLRATWKETLRMMPPIPLGVAHANIADNFYKHYKLSKGTFVQFNIGYIMRDPRLWGEYGKVDEFDPGRFIPEINPGAKELPDVTSIIYGFGRRICPGRYLADRSGMLFIAAILSHFDILPVEGEKRPATAEFVDQLIRRPSDLRCQFVPRQ